MDSLITAAGRSLATGDPLGALKLVALRNDPPALALRGIAMAQLGDFVKAKTLLRGAARGFGAKAAAGACALRGRAGRSGAGLARPGLSIQRRWTRRAPLLEAHGDTANAAHARYLEVRRLLLSRPSR